MCSNRTMSEVFQFDEVIKLQLGNENLVCSTNDNFSSKNLSFVFFFAKTFRRQMKSKKKHKGCEIPRSFLIPAA